MQVEQTHANFPLSTASPTSLARRMKRRLSSLVRLLFHWFFISATILLAIGLIGPQYYTPQEQTNRAIGELTGNYQFNLLRWEIDAVGHKLQAYFEQPTAELSEAEGVELVQGYMERAYEVGRLEQVITAQLALQADGSALAVGDDNAEGGLEETLDIEELQSKLETLRTQQSSERLAVEQVIQQQVASQLVRAGFNLGGDPFPPVLFAFTEPPKKLIVSPRNQISTDYWRMLDAETSLGAVEATEEAIDEQLNLSAYITNIGGLGAFPTMVVDQANLSWVLSTVAHEWVHNYLTLFPLGINYATSSELTTINESVAEIVGNEIGEQTLARYYPELVPPPPSEGELIIRQMLGQYGAPRFSFRAEMRQTRLEVDRLLAEGKVTEAEAYMEERRQLFVEEGYPIRKLNQAYFAFHGSYGTSAASSSPIGPQLESLRAAIPTLQEFMHTVRWFTSPSDLEQALAQWEKP